MTHKCKAHNYQHEYDKCDKCGCEYCYFYWESCPRCGGKIRPTLPDWAEVAIWQYNYGVVAREIADKISR